MPTLGIFVLSILLIVVIVLVSMVHNRFKLKKYIQDLKKNTTIKANLINGKTGNYCMALT
jgi:hypothetical protein